MKSSSTNAFRRASSNEQFLRCGRSFSRRSLPSDYCQFKKITIKDNQPIRITLLGHSLKGWKEMEGNQGASRWTSEEHRSLHALRTESGAPLWKNTHSCGKHNAICVTIITRLENFIRFLSLPLGISLVLSLKGGFCFSRIVRGAAKCMLFTDLRVVSYDAVDTESALSSKRFQWKPKVY